MKSEITVRVNAEEMSYKETDGITLDQRIMFLTAIADFAQANLRRSLNAKLDLIDEEIERIR